MWPLHAGSEFKKAIIMGKIEQMYQAVQDDQYSEYYIEHNRDKYIKSNRKMHFILLILAGRPEGK